MRLEHQMTCANRHSQVSHGALRVEETDGVGTDGAATIDRFLTAIDSWFGVSPPWPRTSMWSHPLTRRVWTILTCTVLLLCTQGAANADSLHTGSLAADARQAANKNLPILLFFTQPGCAFCQRARREYLRPLAESGAWSARTLIREIAIETTIAGIDGNSISGRDLARSYGIRAFPTVIFIDGNGRQIAEPVAGFTVPDFYAAYLEQRLEAAIARLTKS